jgi:hypothetical protein
MTNHAYLDRLTALFLIASCGGLSADHGQKRELGGVTITGGLDLIEPITEGREPINSKWPPHVLSWAFQT